MRNQDPAPIAIKVWRVRQAVKQTELAERLGISETTLCNIEAGRYEPGADLKGRIREITGIDWDEPVANGSEDETLDLPAPSEVAG